MKKLFAILLAVAMIMSFALVASADETYTASLMYMDSAFNIATALGVGTVTTPITGPGTYTLSYDIPATGSNLYMLYIEIPNAYDKIGDWTVSDVQVTVDGNAVTVTDEGVYVYEGNAFDDLGNLVPTNSYIIELRNDFAGYSLSTGVGAVPFDTAINENITVTFTLTDPDAAPETEATEAETEETKAEDKDDESTTATKAPSKPDDSNAKTGDAISMVVALMAVSAMGIAVLGKKKN